MYWRLSGLYFFYFMSLGVMIPFWNLYLANKGLTPQQIGILGAVLLGTKIISPSVLGWLGDKSSSNIKVVRIANVLALLIFSLLLFLPDSLSMASTAGNAITENVAQSGNVSLFTFVLLLSIVFGFSFFWNGVISQYDAITLYLLGNRYARYGWIRVWGSIGFMLVVLFTGWYFNRWPINHVEGWVLLSMGLILLSSFTIPSLKLNKQVEGAFALFMQRLKEPNTLIVFFVCFLMNFSFATYYTFYSIYLDGLGYSQWQIGLLWSVSVIAEIVLFLFIGKLIQRLGLKYVIIGCLFAAAIRWGLTPQVKLSLEWMIFLQVLHALSFAAFHASAVEWIRRQFGDVTLAQGQAAYSAVGYGLGGAVGSLVIGFLWTEQPSEAWSFCWYLAACIALLAAVLMMFTSRRGLELRLS